MTRESNHVVVTGRAEQAASRKLVISPFQSDLLDLARWIAAFLVVVEHVRSLMFRPYGAEPHSGVFERVFYFATGFGHVSVMIFFVMSGFLVGGKVLERLMSGTFSWPKYLVDRMSRLYAVYLLALLLGGALDYFGYHYFNRFGLYDKSFSGTIAVVNHDFHANLTPLVFGVNLAMCQTILAPVLGSNGPLWSLANEFWYYLAGPLLFALFFLRAWGRRVLGGIALAVLIHFLPASILIYSLVWFMGAALYFLNTRSLLPFWLTAPLFLASFSLARLQWIKVPHAEDFIVGITFALLLNSGCRKLSRLPVHWLSRKAADFSYSVYLCHFPLLVFVLSALYQTTGIGLQNPCTPARFCLCLAVVGLLYACSFIVSLATERQTPRIRNLLYSFVGRKIVTRCPEAC